MLNEWIIFFDKNLFFKRWNFQNLKVLKILLDVLCNLFSLQHKVIGYNSNDTIVHLKHFSIVNCFIFKHFPRLLHKMQWRNTVWSRNFVLGSTLEFLSCFWEGWMHMAEPEVKDIRTIHHIHIALYITHLQAHCNTNILLSKIIFHGISFEKVWFP